MKIKFIFGASVILFLVCICVQHVLAETTTQNLQQIYSSENPSRKIKILIVPGHDTEYWGTEFRNVKEGDMTLALGQNLYALLKQDPKFDVTITRDGLGENSYTQDFADYFKNNTPAIEDFITTTHNSYQQSLSTGSILKLEGVPHNSVNSDIALRLYGIDKWANDNNVDLVLHIHFNDVPDRPNENPGPYSGFAIYIPEKQYANGPESAIWGAALYNALIKYYPKSTLPAESGGLVPEQDLIAIGPGNSLKPASALIEYSYIYEPQFLDPTIRAASITDLAYQTYKGIYNFFGTTTPQSLTQKFDTPLLPYTWASASSTVKYGVLNNPDILALQAALRLQGFYSTSNDNPFLDCRVTGNFNPCTKQALMDFQTKYSIESTGNLGPITRKKLNQLFSK